MGADGEGPPFHARLSSFTMYGDADDTDDDFSTEMRHNVISELSTIDSMIFMLMYMLSIADILRHDRFAFIDIDFDDFTFIVIYAPSLCHSASHFHAIFPACRMVKKPSPSHIDDGILQSRLLLALIDMLYFIYNYHDMLPPLKFLCFHWLRARYIYRGDFLHLFTWILRRDFDIATSRRIRRQ